jgi:hypothetical protein
MEPELIQSMPYPEHPNRCQGLNKHGQCHNLAVSNGTFCRLHGGAKQLESQRAKSLKNYRAGQWQAKINRFSESPQIKDLREEIGILRMLMEERLDFCKSPHDLLLQSHTISDLVVKIEKLVSSCHKLEGSLGQHMDKTALMGFAQQVINVISINVVDRDTVDTIANNIVNLITEVKDED